jgi:hypothetical protein
MDTPKLDGICVLVDGGCLNQNKPVSERTIYGSLKVYYNGKPVLSEWAQHKALQHKMGFEADVDGVVHNQRAELKAMEVAMRYVELLRDRMQGTSNPLTAITILSDSEYALGWGAGDYQGDKRTADVVKDYSTRFGCWRAKLEYQRVKVTYQHVPEAWVKTQLGH